jgi:hypothetical protein
MAGWSSSSLAFSDHNNMRQKNSGLIKNFPTRISKQHISEQKMFGSKRKGILIGKQFKKSGKGISSKPSSAKMPKSSGISPSLEDFDKMMKSVVGSSKGSKNGFGKSMFSRKSFG